MSQYLVFALLIFLAVIVAVWVAPPFGSFGLSDQ